mmetsp:Transcript_39150/g.155192  ORF Transcript_39150/g.155192 Transcript_39150/m.155192 type:complete len:153 (+) Transcript_39150:2487-2945(+)
MRAIRSVTFVSSLLLGHPNNQHIMVSTRSMVRPANVRLAAATRGTSEGEEEPAKKKKPRSPRKKSEPEPVVDDGLHRLKPLQILYSESLVQESLSPDSSPRFLPHRPGVLGLDTKRLITMTRSGDAQYTMTSSSLSSSRWRALKQVSAGALF